MSIRKALITVLAISVLAKSVVGLAMGSSVDSLPGIADQISYDALAQRLLNGYGFSFAVEWWPLTHPDVPTAFWSFLYTLYLAAVYATVGIQPVVARLIQAMIVGIAWPLLAYRLGKRVSGETVGLVAAAWSAVYGYFAYYGAALMTEPFYITGILLALELAYMIADGRKGAGAWMALGLILGAVVLLRQLFLLFVPFLLGWILVVSWQRSGQVGARRTLVGVVASLAVVGLMIAPFTLRNVQAFGRFVLLNTNSGYALFFGNHSIYGTQFQPILTGDVSYRDLIPRDLLALDEAALDQALAGEAVRIILADPGRYALLSLSRVPVYFQFWPSADSSTLSNIVRVLSFGLALPFMALGLVLALREWRRWSLLYLFVLVYTIVHILSWALIRYRLPVDAVLLVFAAHAVVALARRLRSLAPSRPNAVAVSP